MSIINPATSNKATNKSNTTTTTNALRKTSTSMTDQVHVVAPYPPITLETSTSTTAPTPQKKIPIPDTGILTAKAKGRAGSLFFFVVCSTLNKVCV